MGNLCKTRLGKEVAYAWADVSEFPIDEDCRWRPSFVCPQRLIEGLHDV